jgi:hypothetical protein
MLGNPHLRLIRWNTIGDAREIKKDSQAFVTTAFNMMQENGVTWDTMSPSARLGLEQQGLASGWPIGTLAALSTVKPGTSLCTPLREPMLWGMI